MAQVVMPENQHRDIPERPAEPQRAPQTIQAHKKKRTITERLVNLFFSDDIDNVQDYLVHDILIPNVLDTILSMVNNGLDMLFRDLRKGGRSDDGNPYHRDSRERTFVQPDTGRSLRSAGSQRKSRAMLNDYYFGNEAEARWVVDQLCAYAEKYDFVSIDDYYQLIGVTGSHVDRNWGWPVASIENAKVCRDRDGWVIEFEKAVPR